MQFYLNGYKPGDPDILDAAPGAETRPAGLPDTVDVLIVGSGPAGMLLAAQLSTFPGITHAHRRAPRRPAAGRSGRRRRVPHGRDVRRLRPEREARPRGLLGQRDRVLAPVAGRPLEDRAHRSRSGHRGRPVGVPAPHRQPGAPAAATSQDYMQQVADAARARLRPGFRDPQGRARGRASRSWSR